MQRLPQLLVHAAFLPLLLVCLSLSLSLSLSASSDVVFVSAATEWLTSVGGVTVRKIDKGAVQSHSGTVNRFTLHTIDAPLPNTDGRGWYERCVDNLSSRSVCPHFCIGVNKSGQLAIAQFRPLSSISKTQKRNNEYAGITVEIGWNSEKSPAFTTNAILTRGVAALFASVRSVFPSIPNRCGAPVSIALAFLHYYFRFPRM
jgi:hypothetical protein